MFGDLLYHAILHYNLLYDIDYLILLGIILCDVIIIMLFNVILFAYHQNIPIKYLKNVSRAFVEC